MTRGVLLVVLLLVALSPPAAGDIPGRGGVYRYHAVNQRLTDVLRAFAWDQRLNIVVDETIQERVISEQVEMLPAQFLNHITGKYGLNWYYDGSSLYIYRGGNIATQTYVLQYSTPAQVINAMRALNAYSDLFPFRTLEDKRVLLVVGPARLLEMTTLVIQTLEHSQATVENEVTIAVFPLTYASAADQSLSFQGKSISIPGVASTLQSILTGDKVTAQYETLLPRNLQGLSGYGLNRFSEGQDKSSRKRNPDPAASAPTADPLTGAPDDAAESPDQSRRPSPQHSAVQASIRADPRLNAVIVKDLPGRIETYRRVIAALDQPTGLIEITAKIIDINKEGLLEWGLPTDFMWGDGTTSQEISLSLTSTDATNLAVTLMQDDVTQFLGQVKALEQDGFARVASRPSLLTLDHIEAQIDNSETFFVRVEGDFEVDLFDVSVGTTLNVVPHIIEQNGQRMVKLAVQIEDGGVLEQSVDEIPRIRSDSITTQAVLRENESLLIGGLIREEKSETESRIPVLGRLPGVGVFFRTKEYNTRRVERLILIEPRIVASPRPTLIRPPASPTAPHASGTSGRRPGPPIVTASGDRDNRYSVERSGRGPSLVAPASSRRLLSGTTDGSRKRQRPSSQRQRDAQSVLEEPKWSTAAESTKSELHEKGAGDTTSKSAVRSLFRPRWFRKSSR